MQRTIVTLVDDIDGSEEDVQTVRFGLDGAQYEIDLGRAQADALHAMARPYIDAGRKAPGLLAPAARPRRSQADRDRSRAVRQWARDHAAELGEQVDERGRIPEHVTRAANAAGVGI